ncbi:HU family DNA-binding protein [Campylobacter sp. MOP7]|uniref:HU family DNA-binding protein n=1 Tax=Campylobacter canis TaxID=3378588 RepID=UPI00387E29C0
MNKQKLVNELVKKTQSKGVKLTKTQALAAWDGAIEVLKDSFINGESVKFIGFGTFKVSKRPERVAKMVNSDKMITIPAHNAVSFASSKVLKKEMNETSAADKKSSKAKK